MYVRRKRSVEFQILTQEKSNVTLNLKYGKLNYNSMTREDPTRGNASHYERKTLGMIMNRREQEVII
eukprot:m.298082 g.298082  ORF g.298082 m.298082 type:complete len:67 (-) comp16407_c0_seq13:271-471(-)